MADCAPNETAPCACASGVRRWVVKIISLIALGVAMGLCYDWAVPRFYGADRQADFFLGTLHGALMPAALPTLVMGNDVPIYAANNSGRRYKIGYITGINLCGLTFFGVAFCRPRKA